MSSRDAEIGRAGVSVGSEDDESGPDLPGRLGQRDVCLLDYTSCRRHAQVGKA